MKKGLNGAEEREKHTEKKKEEEGKQRGQLRNDPGEITGRREGPSSERFLLSAPARAESSAEQQRKYFNTCRVAFFFLSIFSLFHCRCSRLWEEATLLMHYG